MTVMKQSNKGMIILDMYNPIYLSTLETFSLPDEQRQFTGMPLEMIKLAKEDHSRNPIVILNHNNPVGFFVLQNGARVVEYTDNPNALLLIAFSINETEQGKGFAKDGLQLLDKFVKQHFPTINEIVLAVNMRNNAARQLYERVGFIDKGIRKMGQIGEQAILSLQL
ncbi:GNAT family N-acetyltransferase [Bacillus salitolerans]|uniref:GNAT family N-acetyltransferase n=1 Tax=Bacillus salitolerans TaxID=1437434 RepID=A0ABW4LTP9_9BACI